MTEPADQAAEDPTPSSSSAAAAAAEPCADCLSARGILFAAAFAAFAAYVAADFALGGKLTAWVAATALSVRGRLPDGTPRGTDGT
jgi:hypothetical protein